MFSVWERRMPATNMLMRTGMLRRVEIYARRI
jgi:hypothetical protein